MYFWVVLTMIIANILSNTQRFRPVISTEVGQFRVAPSVTLSFPNPFNQASFIMNSIV